MVLVGDGTAIVTIDHGFLLSDPEAGTVDQCEAAQSDIDGQRKFAQRSGSLIQCQHKGGKDPHTGLDYRNGQGQSGEYRSTRRGEVDCQRETRSDNDGTAERNRLQEISTMKCRVSGGDDTNAQGEQAEECHN